MITEQTGILLTVISTREALQLAESELLGASDLLAEWHQGLSEMERGILKVYDNAVQRALNDIIDQHQRNRH
ncbi:MAG: hypothetical protein KZQ99_04650 [Candidatus Thiodiazotropha sp. (ex Dulcina madagascariensis)]|nr:hypothetical protein [Candidatus Thiodiazotropha sp. (ex Dulcina madagascariensis)]